MAKPEKSKRARTRVRKRKRDEGRKGWRELSLSCQGQSISNATIRITTRGRATPPCSWSAPNQMLSWRNKNTHRLKTEDRYGGYMCRARQVLSLLFQFLACDECVDFCEQAAKGERAGGGEGREETGRSLELVGRGKSEIATWQ